jgi:hypothetical protein
VWLLAADWTVTSPGCPDRRLRALETIQGEVWIGARPHRGCCGFCPWPSPRSCRRAAAHATAISRDAPPLACCRHAVALGVLRLLSTTTGARARARARAAKRTPPPATVDWLRLHACEATGSLRLCPLCTQPDCTPNHACLLQPPPPHVSIGTGLPTKAGVRPQVDGWVGRQVDVVSTCSVICPL